MTSATDPAVSVIIASRNSQRHIAACLQALRNQKTAVPFEIIVSDSSTDGTDQLIRRDFPEVQLIHFKQRKFPGDARNAAIAKARSAIFAFIDTDCVAAPDWVERIWQAHNSGRPSIGGIVENGTPGSIVGSAAYLLEFTQWMPQRDAKAVDEIPTCNLSIRRDAFEKYGPFLEGTYCSDTAFHWRLARDGGHAWLDPAIRVSHTNITDAFHFVTHEFFHGRSYGRVRAWQQSFSGMRRLVYSAGSLLLPPVLFFRIVRRCLRNRRYLRELALSTPLLFLAIAFWSIGEARGYLDPPNSPEP